MIKFPCKCGQVFNLTEDMAGGLIQCPRCGLLADVPLLSDLAHITEDGIFKLEEPATITDDIGIAELQEVFTRQTIDANGVEKDLRGDEHHFEKIGVPREVDSVGYSPKYDPVTGELIRPLEVIGDSSVLPISVQSANTLSLSYATPESSGKMALTHILLELVMPGNAVVMFFLFIFYVAAGFLGTFLAVYSLFFHIWLQVLNVPLWLIAAHYGCVIEEIGPDAQDELPRPMRHLDFNDDLWNPFFQVTLAAVICYFPMMLAAAPRVHLGAATEPVVVLLNLIGSFFFPAVVLTAVTGTTIANLRPDRVLGVIRLSGMRYGLVVGVFILALLPTQFYLLGESSLPQGLVNLIPAQVSKPVVMFPVLAVSVYLMHLFCWLLGLLYRARHDDFPWILQRHIKQRRDPAVAPPRPHRKMG